MYVHCMCAWHPLRSEEGIGFPETSVRDGCGPPHGCWELNQGPLQEKQVFLTAEPSLQPPHFPTVDNDFSQVQRLVV